MNTCKQQYIGWCFVTQSFCLDRSIRLIAENKLEWLGVNLKIFQLLSLTEQRSMNFAILCAWSHTGTYTVKHQHKAKTPLPLLVHKTTHPICEENLRFLPPPLPPPSRSLLVDCLAFSLQNTAFAYGKFYSLPRAKGANAAKNKLY